MAVAPICPSCRQVRVPDARYCHHCGRPFDGKPQSVRQERTAPPDPRPPLDVSVWTAIKLGFGMAVGVVLFGLLLLPVSLALITAFVRTSVGALPR